MKKLIILAVAVLLALPCVSYAGSATSRWDLTIGGMVKFDLQYADQALNTEVTFAERGSGTADSARDEYGALTWASGETRLNFLIKGPDTWGAKTSAFIEADFRRAATQNFSSGATLGPNNSSYGGFGLRHAFMKFDWPTFSLLMGSSWTLPGALPCFCLLTVNELGPFNKSYFLPQIQAVWQATKQFSWAFGAIAPYDGIKGLSGTPAPGIAMDDFARSGWPMLFTEFLYKTDACGKIGPWMLQFGLGGFYGQEEPIIPGSDARTTQRWVPGAPGDVAFFSPTGYDDDNVDMWMATYKMYVPIIPEKKPGQLAGSLGFALTAFTGQNVRTLIPPPPMIQSLQSYDRNPADANADFAAPVVSGGWTQLAFYLTNTVWVGGYYGQSRVYLSQTRKTRTPPSGVEFVQHYVFNVVYDPNPAIRLGLEYANIMTHYARSLRPALDSTGKVNVVHFAAQYFF